MRTIPSSFNESFGNYSIDIQLLKDQIVKDRAVGLKPSFIVGCLGGTNTSAIDQNDILAEIAEEEKAGSILTRLMQEVFVFCQNLNIC
jgi:glutamate/tyrosine decarboxylase-like PLP-dependent enzyme